MNGPLKAESPTAIGLNANETANTEIVIEHQEERKRESTLIAQFAMRRHVVHKTIEGGYVVCRDRYAKHCQTLEALQAFAKQVGVVR